MMKRSWLTLAVLAGALALAGGCNCGTNPPVGGENDAGEEELADSGTTDTDAGEEPDAGDADGGEMDLDGGELDAGELDGGEADAGEEDAGMVEPDAGVTPTTLCQDVAKKKCDYFVRCRTDDADDQNRANDKVAASEQATCEAQQDNLGCQVLAKGWELGRSTFDETKYFECIDATYPANTCARDLNTVIEKCTNFPFLQAGTMPGGTCTADVDCIGGYCAKMGTNPPATACGTCQAYVANNQSCQRDAQCNPATSYCDNFGAFGGGTNTCQPYKAAMATCDNDEECGAGNVCAATGVGFTRACRAGVALGGACTGGRFECARTVDVNAQLSNGTDLPELICSTNSGAGTCIKLQTTAGGVCGNAERIIPIIGPQGPFCPETEFCAAGLCTPRRMAGQPCTNTDQCAFGTFCEGGSQTCVAYKDVGGTCSNTNGSQCMNLLGCQGATCQPGFSNLGEPCNGTQPCAQGYCDGASMTCTALKADGAACGGANTSQAQANAQCESNVCSQANGGMCVDACWD